jgi:CRP-like cAMP-binding protein
VSATHDPRQNHLLATLPAAAFERLQPHLQLLSLPPGEAPFESGVVVRYVYLAGAMQHLLLRYTQALLTQMAQTAVCNRHHSLDEQLCRWLLLSLGRLASNELVMTQELMANMLGVRREGVTEAAGKLQQAGLIHYSRGRITVMDRAGLEARTCECYAVVKKECHRLLPDLIAS